MKTLAWIDLKHKSSPEVRERIKRDAVEELESLGFSSLRKARQMTQTELAKVLDVDQASVSALEGRTDLLLSTLAKYIRGLGGDMQIRAVFPDVTFNLEPLGADPTARKPRRTKPKGKPVVAKRNAPVSRLKEVTA